MFLMYFPGIITLIFSILFCIYNELSIYFILNPNNFTVKKNTFCKKKVQIYNSGEILRIECKQNRTYSHRGPTFTYELIVITTKEEPENLYYLNESFTFEEIGYFLHVVNQHIQNKMNNK